MCNLYVTGNFPKINDTIQMCWVSELYTGFAKYPNVLLKLSLQRNPAGKRGNSDHLRPLELLSSRDCREQLRIML